MTRPASEAVRTLLVLAERYAAHERRTLGALSGMILGKGGFFRGLALGGDCKTATAERVIQWFVASWPDDLDWPQDITTQHRPQRALALPPLNPEFLSAVSHASFWKSGRRPMWWYDLEVREFLIRHCNQMSIPRAAAKGRALFGDRCPKKSAIHEFWSRISPMLGSPDQGSKEHRT
jgi:hypothetical protein